jgi:hypothetical protein
MPAKVIFPDVLLTTIAIVMCMDDHVDVVAAYRPYTRGGTIPLSCGREGIAWDLSRTTRCFVYLVIHKKDDFRSARFIPKTLFFSQYMAKIFTDKKLPKILSDVLGCHPLSDKRSLTHRHISVFPIDSFAFFRGRPFLVMPYISSTSLLLCLELKVHLDGRW